MNTKVVLSKLLSDRLDMDDVKDFSEWNQRFKEMDSLDMIDLVFAIEDHFRVKLPAECNMSTFDDLALVLEEELCRANCS